jgi:hypothetical protein
MLRRPILKMIIARGVEQTQPSGFWKIHDLRR